jgi:DNA-binding transcriptional MerR regulator
MDKAFEAFRTISEVGEDLDIPQHVLRFWETRFAQIKPLKRGGGRRYYRPDDVELLKGIRHLLYKEGYTIKGVQRILKENGVRAVQAFADGRPESVPADWTPAPAPDSLPSQKPPPLVDAPRSVALGSIALAPAFDPAPLQVPEKIAPTPLVPAPAFERAVMRDSEPFFEAPTLTPRAELSVLDVPPLEISASEMPDLEIPDLPIATPPEPAASPLPGQVSMFRGGLSRSSEPAPKMVLLPPALELPAVRNEHAAPRFNLDAEKLDDASLRAPGFNRDQRARLEAGYGLLAQCKAEIEALLSRQSR